MLLWIFIALQITEQIAETCLLIYKQVRELGIMTTFEYLVLIELFIIGVMLSLIADLLKDISKKIKS